MFKTLIKLPKIVIKMFKILIQIETSNYKFLVRKIKLNQMGNKIVVIVVKHHKFLYPTPCTRQYQMPCIDCSYKTFSPPTSLFCIYLCSQWRVRFIAWQSFFAWLGFGVRVWDQRMSYWHEIRYISRIRHIYLNTALTFADKTKETQIRVQMIRIGTLSRALGRPVSIFIHWEVDFLTKLTLKRDR